MNEMCTVFFLTLLIGAIASQDDIQIYANIWRAEPEKDVNAYVTVIATSSALSCVRECMTRSMSKSCGYDGSAGLCLLEVTTASDEATTTAPVQPNAKVTLYTRMCQQEEAPIDWAITNVTWRKTLLGKVGDLSCKDDFLYSGDDPTLRCSISGSWSADGECRRRTWTGDLSVGHRYPLPRPPIPQWSVCAEGVPTENHRFTFNLDCETSIVLHVDFRKYHPQQIPSNDTILIDTYMDGRWRNNFQMISMTPFPLEMGRSFSIRITALDWTTVQLFVDGSLIARHTVPDTVSIQQVVAAQMLGTISFTMLDLWCGN